MPGRLVWLPLSSRYARGAPAARRGFFCARRAKGSYFVSAMHFLTKAAFCSIGMFSRIALSSHARIFLASVRDSIFSGAVDFMLVASAGGENQSMHRDRLMMVTIAGRMVVSQDEQTQ